MQVATLVSEALDPSTVEQVRALLPAAGVPDWLAPGRACDIPFAGPAPALTLPGVDIAVQPAAGRRKRLLLADMDSTIVTSETLDELAGAAGIKEQIAAVTRRAMNGEIDFATALTERVALLAGLPDSALADTFAATRLTPGAARLVATMRAHGAHCVLVSGGFTFFTCRIAALCGFHEHLANRLELAGGRLTGRVLPPILDRQAKLATLTQRAAALGLDPAAACTVGDGANDLDMIRAAGLGVAFRAKPIVAAEARFRVDHGDLTALLYFQGYREAEILS